MFGEENKRWMQLGLFAALLYLVVTNIERVAGVGKLILSAASPLLVGCVFAYMLNILMGKLEKYYFPNENKEKKEEAWKTKTRRPMCLVLSFVIVLLILVLLFKLVIPELASSLTLIAKEIPIAFEHIRIWLLENSEGMPSMQEMLKDLNINWPQLLQKIAGYVTAGATGVITSAVMVVSATAGVVTKVAIGMIFAIYLLFNKETLFRQTERLQKAFLKKEQTEKLKKVLEIANDTFTSFIVGQFTEAVIIGVLCTLGMLLFRFPYAAMTGTVIGVTALIPVVGAYIGACVGAFMIFTVNPVQALLFLVFLVALQQLEGNLIYPRVVGHSIGLPGMWVLAAVTVGGGVFGIAGMLIGVPMAATVYKLLRLEVNGRIGSGTPKTEKK